MRRRARALGLLLTAAFLQHTAAAEPPQSDDAVYGYTDDSGRLRYVDRLDEVPPRLRQYARRVDLHSEAVSSPSGDAAFMYRYRGPDGRTRFTNLLETVPPAQRKGARLDLRQVSLNTELGHDLERHFAGEHERLLQAPHCQQLIAAATRPLLRAVWDDHGPLVVTGAAILILFAISPFMLRRVGSQWAKALSMAIPALALVGLVAYGIVRSGKALSLAKTAASPCEPKTFSKLASREHGLVEQYQLLEGLRAQQQGLEQIAREGR